MILQINMEGQKQVNPHIHTPQFAFLRALGLAVIDIHLPDILHQREAESDAYPSDAHTQLGIEVETLQLVLPLEIPMEPFAIRSLV